MSSGLRAGRKIGAVLYGLLAGIAVFIILPLGALVLGIAFMLINQATHLIELGEAEAWLGILFAQYAFYAAFVIGPIVWWKVCARRLAFSRRVNRLGTTAVIVVFSIVCGWVVFGEQAIEMNINLEAVTNDGKLGIADYTPQGSSTLYKIDTNSGVASPLTPTLRGYETDAAFSPDGQQVVFTYSDDERNHRIMLTDVSGSNPHPLLPHEGGNDSMSRFSPDGKTVYFVRSESTANGSAFDLFSTSVSGENTTQLTSQHFSLKRELDFLRFWALSSDGKELLFTREESLLLYSLSNPDKAPSPVVFQMPKAPSNRQYVSAYFSPDDRGIVFMGAAEGKDGFDYDAYRLDLGSRQLQKLTANNGYASDFRLSPNGAKAVFLKWKYSRFQKLPRSYQLQLMDMQSGTVTPVTITGFPK